MLFIFIPPITIFKMAWTISTFLSIKHNEQLKFIAVLPGLLTQEIQYKTIA